MKPWHILTLCFAALALFAVASDIWHRNENKILRFQLDREVANAQLVHNQLTQQLTEARQRAERAEANAATVVQASRTLVESRPNGTSAATRVIDSGTLLNETNSRAQALIRAGKQAEGLKEYLSGYRQLKATRRASAESQVMMATLERFGRVFPPAKEALRELRDTAMREFQEERAKVEESRLALPPFTAIVTEIALLNQRLGDEAATVAFHDSLPPIELLRRLLRSTAYAHFVELRRYEEAAQGRPFSTMLSHLDRFKRVTGDTAPAVAARATYIEAAALNLQVLTALGRTDEARMLTEAVFALDGSEATRALVQRHTNRARQPLAQPAAP